MTIKERYDGIIGWFQENMPVAESELHYRNAYELLVAVSLSAQCTDKRVNQTTPSLFAAYPTPRDMSYAEVGEIYEYIRSISYPNNKARNLSKMSKMLCDEYGGEVPEDLELLQRLPGVGRKSANVMGAVLWGREVMPVDTHVYRLAARIGLVGDACSVYETEVQLTRHIPGHLLPVAHHWLILHGRYVCKARRPLCDVCGLTSWCRMYSRGV